MTTFIHSSFGLDEVSIQLPLLEEVGNQKKVNYQSLLESIENNPDNSCMVIPSSIQGWQFSWQNFIEHLRLSNSTHAQRSHVLIICEKEEKTSLEKEVDKKPWSYGVWVHSEDELPEILSSYQEPMSTDDYSDIRPSVGNFHPNKEGPHDRANIWGPYRLLKCIAGEDERNDDYKLIETDLLQSPFWRKRIVDSIPGTDDSAKLSNFKTHVEEQLTTIRNFNLRVCILDDELKRGWDIAYKKLFKDSPVIDFFDSPDRFPYQGLDDKFDLLMLDLRLTEKAAGNAGDMLDVENLSGMEVLKEIRKNGNLLPVIMATASNKSWSYETAIQNGANGYWEKERPDLDTSMLYSFSNTTSLLKTIVKVVEWNNRISPILYSLSKVQEAISYPVVELNVQKKRNTIIGQLYSEQTKFLSDYFGKSGEKTAFLSIWSIVNDIRDYFLEKRDDAYFLKHLDWDVPYCSLEKRGTTPEYILSDEVLNYFRRNLSGVGIPRSTPHLNETPLIILTIALRSVGPDQIRENLKMFFELKTVRNHLSWIHGHTQLSARREQPREWKFKYIEDVSKLWELIFAVTP